MTTTRAIKGFDANLRCRGFQFAAGETYTYKGKVKACESGFHAVSGHPLAVFAFYPPAGSRFAFAEQSGALHSDDNVKTASEILKVGEEIGFAELTAEAVKWVFDRSTPEGATATGVQGAASATGARGAASATGWQGAASATGVRGRAMGAEGCALFLVYRDDEGAILHVWAGLVGQGGVKPLVWYTLGEDGSPTEVDD